MFKNECLIFLLLLDDSIIGEDLVGMQMPSHEDIVDGSEVPGDGMKFQCGHFERSSSSEEEIAVTKLSVSSRSEDSDSEFEIIDRREVAAMKNIWAMFVCMSYS